MSMCTTRDQSYDRRFFEDQALGSLRSARIVLPKLFATLQPRRVLDVGCGVGSWLRASLELGAEDVMGLDGDYVDRDALMVPREAFRSADLASQRLRDVLTEQARFDLVICMEVAEHLPHSRAASLVEDLTECSDFVLFSAAVPFQYGTNHINEQWPEFWAILFRAHGFDCFDFLRDDLWADRNVEWWYAQNALVFARSGSAAEARLPSRSRVEGRGLARVHPEGMLANLLGLPRRHRHAASAEEFADLHALVDAHLRGAETLPPLAAQARAASADPEARDVFPWTRIDVAEPEREIARLAERVATQEAALAAETARRKAAEQLAEQERTLRSRAQDRDRHHASQALAAELQLEAQAAARRETDEKLAAALASQRLAEEGARQEIAALHAGLGEAMAARDAAAAEFAAARQELDALRDSTLWRVTGPIRAAGGRVPAPVRSVVRASARLAWRASKAPPVVTPAVEATLSLPPSADAESIRSEAEAAPETHELKCYGRVLGTVSWWTLAAATTRLRRFALFNAEDYLRRNPDVAAAGVDPYSHFVQSGAFEDRGRVDPEHLARVLSSYTLRDHAERALPPEPEDGFNLAAAAAEIGRIGVYVSSHGNVFMEEIAEDLATDLRTAGATVDLLDENAPIDDRPAVCIYVAPHEFFALGRGRDWVRDDVFSGGFMLGTEQVQTTWFGKALPIVLLSRGVLDICSQTADLFARTSMAALHLLPGIRMRPHGLTERDRQHLLFRALPRAAQAEPNPRSPFASRPIDIAFFGTSSSRRDRFFARNASFLADFETFSYCRRASHGPINAGGEDGALTRLAGHVSSHSKITLNIHREEFGYFEWHRMVRLGMCSGSVVVSDPCLPHPSFVANEHYFQERARHIPDLLEWLLRTEGGRREAERVRANVDRVISTTFETERAAARVLRFLARHRLRADGVG